MAWHGMAGIRLPDWEEMRLDGCLRQHSIIDLVSPTDGQKSPNEEHDGLQNEGSKLWARGYPR